MDFEKRAKELVSQMTLPEKLSQLCYNSPAIPRLGIPAYTWWNEGLHGVARSGTATVFPQAIAMAASFDEQLMYEVACVIATEARAKYNAYRQFDEHPNYEGLTFWSPNINIFRDPRWGRGHETYGEDPFLTAKMGTAFVKGLQGEGKYRKLDATLKHFAAHSGPEGIRHGFDSRVSEEDLENTYLYAFRYCIENAHPSAVMGAYNAINGEPCCASKDIIQSLLREKLGFDGYYVSDCGAICDVFNAHKKTDNIIEAAALALNSGCDLNCGNAYVHLAAAAAMGLISEQTVTKSVERLFYARFRLGMFDEDCEYNSIGYDVIECDEHRALNRKMAQQSMVLLKNNGILPLNNVQRIAVIGPAADDKDVLLANYNGTPSIYSTLLSGIRQGFDGKVIYARGCHHYKEEWSSPCIHEAVVAAQNADVVILCVGLCPDMEGEEGDTYNADMAGDKKTLSLPDIQNRLITAVTQVGKPVIYVNVSGSCVDLSYAKQHSDAIIQCFYPGAEGGDALADIIFGKVSPCGRLPITFYQSVDDLPPFEDYGMKGRTYKFYGGKAVYEFGDGLTYGDITEEWQKNGSVILTNNGKYDVNYTLLKFEYIPHKSLCGIRKVFIKAGQQIKVEI